jgi:hypothetical protein
MCAKVFSDEISCEELSLLKHFNIKECTLRQMFEFPYRPASQKNTMWCWAACLEAMLLFQNVDFVSQEEIVVRLFGGIANEPANMQWIEAGINGEWRDKNNPYFAVKCFTQVFFPMDRNSLEEAFSEAMKFFQDKSTHVAIGLRSDTGKVGHLVLANEFRIAHDNAKLSIRSIQVFDPLLPDTSNGFRNLSAVELEAIDLIFSLQIEVL